MRATSTDLSRSHSRLRFLEGPAGSGKTSKAIQHIRSLIEAGNPADSILLLTPHRIYARVYEEAFDPTTWYALGKATIGGLARRYVSLFWPEVWANERHPFSGEQEPNFLTYEAAQYFMARLVSPLVEQGYFADLKLTRHRLYSQLLDNLNKAAANAISLNEIGQYLGSARIAEGTAVEEVHGAVRAYREFCSKHNLIDFSLCLELFWALLQSSGTARDHLFTSYGHLVYDNSEEDIPLAHDVVQFWMQDSDSGLQTALVLYDNSAGFRKFLAANPQSAYMLKRYCNEHELTEVTSRVPDSLQEFGHLLIDAIAGRSLPQARARSAARRFTVHADRLHHQMVDRVAGQVENLVSEGAAPADIAIISPFLNDSIFYALSTHLERAGIAHYLHRPSRSLRDDPVTKVLLTIAMLAHPAWDLQRPSREAVAHMLSRCLADADLIRANLLAVSVDEGVQRGLGLKTFEDVPADMRQRISYAVGEAYEQLRQWLQAYQEEEPVPLDHFFSRLFGEVLSQPRLGFHKDVAAGSQVASVIESARAFRRAAGEVMESENEGIGRAYVQMVQEGVIAASYRASWADPKEAVLIAPAHTFLLRNRACAHQMWLDVGSTAWHRRIHQPLTNPYVLSRNWNPETEWDSNWETRFETERLTSIVSGLVARCTKSVHLYVSELSAHGQEQRGTLLSALGQTLRQLSEPVSAELKELV